MLVTSQTRLHVVTWNHLMVAIYGSDNAAEWASWAQESIFVLISLPNSRLMKNFEGQSPSCPKDCPLASLDSQDGPASQPSTSLSQNPTYSHGRNHNHYIFKNVVDASQCGLLQLLLRFNGATHLCLAEWSANKTVEADSIIYIQCNGHAHAT